MGKIVATYLVKLTQREPDGVAPEDAPEPALLDSLTSSLEEAAAGEFGGEWNATAERTDI